MKPAQKKKTTIHIYIDGSGQRADGTGSAIAWYRVNTQKRYVKKIDGLTNNEAEYGAALSAAGALSADDEAEFLTDSELLFRQFNGKCKVSDPRLFDLLTEFRELIERKRLRIEVKWIPRRDNL